MIVRRRAVALCAMVSCLLLTGVVNAYPTSSGTTLTKTYRPLDLDLNTLVESYGGYTSGLTLIGGDLLLTLVYTGTYTGSGPGYPSDATGSAGHWVYQLDTSKAPGLAVSEEPSKIIVSADKDTGFGTFTYVGGLVQPASGVLPADDTPQVNDVFKLFTLHGGSQLTAILLGADFVVTVEDLAHVGPFVFSECKDGEEIAEGCSKDLWKTFGVTLVNPDPADEYCLVLDDGEDGRNYPGCTADTLGGCGTVTGFSATSIPEPGTVALFGLGLAGLGTRLRSRRKAPFA
jgi:hypothetical protein